MNIRLQRNSASIVSAFDQCLTTVRWWHIQHQLLVWNAYHLATSVNVMTRTIQVESLLLVFLDWLHPIITSLLFLRTTRPYGYVHRLGSFLFCLNLVLLYIFLAVIMIKRNILTRHLWQFRIVVLFSGVATVQLHFAVVRSQVVNSVILDTCIRHLVRRSADDVIFQIKEVLRHLMEALVVWLVVGDDHELALGGGLRLLAWVGDEEIALMLLHHIFNISSNLNHHFAILLLNLLMLHHILKRTK